MCLRWLEVVPLHVSTQQEANRVMYSSTLNIEAVLSSETSEFYRATRRHIQDDRSLSYSCATILYVSKLWDTAFCEIWYFCGCGCEKYCLPECDVCNRFGRTFYYHFHGRRLYFQGLGVLLPFFLFLVDLSGPRPYLVLPLSLFPHSTNSSTLKKEAAFCSESW
jgi:hypothetical protein